MTKATRAIFVLTLAAVSGPLLAVAASEICLQTGAALPVPEWDYWLTAVALYGLVTTALLSGIAVIAALRHSSLAPTMQYIVMTIAGITISAFSLLFSLLPVINGVDERYSQIPSNSTVWASGFSDSRFAAVRVGTPISELSQLLGEPIARLSVNGQEVWVYSQIGHYQRRSEKGFHQRAVAVDGTTVVRIWRRYVTAEASPF